MGQARTCREEIISLFAEATVNAGKIPENASVRASASPRLCYPSDDPVSFTEAIGIICDEMKRFAKDGYCEMIFELTDGQYAEEEFSLMPPADMTVYVGETVEGGELAVTVSDIFMKTGYTVGFPFMKLDGKYIVAYRIQWLSLPEAEAIARAVLSAGGYEAFKAGVPVEDIDA